MSLVSTLNRFSGKVAKRTDIIAACLVLSIVFMLIMPLPLWLVDILIGVNICISSLLVILSLYLPGPLAFSTFPSVLMLTTLFRLGLSVSTTRLILLEGDAGHIVEAFGNFVVGGNLVVGLIVFLILTLVNFLVITKGSERVAEVGARFTLDAMPGKQMSIDADLRAGYIDGATARQRRNDLAKESALHGAMDGALKFVKGDAIAGLIIVAINLIGGFAIGVAQKGMTAADAMHKYSILTIGDGLIAQIPALLISITAGLIITRISDEEDKASVGAEMFAQIGSQPRSMMLTGGAMAAFALIPGMPTGVFLLLGAVVGGLGYLKSKATATNSAIALPEAGAVTKDPQTVPEVRDMNLPFPFLFRVPLALAKDHRILELEYMLRTRRNWLVMRYGVGSIPGVIMEAVEGLAEDAYEICVYEVPVVYGVFHWDKIVVNEPQVVLDKTGIPYEVLEDRIGGKPRLWVNASEESRLQEAGLNYDHLLEDITKRWQEVIMRNCKSFFGIHEASKICAYLENKKPELAKELARHVPLPKMTEIFQRLLAEQVSIKNIELIVDTLIEWGQRERDVVLLVEYVRIALRRHICSELSENGMLGVYLLAPETEELIRSSIRQTSHGNFLALDPNVTRTLLDNIANLISTGESRAKAALLTTQDLRRYVRKLIEDEFFDLPVLSYPEMTQEIRVQPLGKITATPAGT